MTQRAADLLPELARDQGFAADLRRRAAARGGTVVLPEGEDPRVLEAALVLREMGIAQPWLVGAPGRLRRNLIEAGADPGAFVLLDPSDDSRADAVAERLRERRRGKLTQGEAMVLSRDPVHFGAGLVGLGLADAVVAGAAHATGDVIRAGIFHVGLAEGISVVSGAFLMVPPAGHAVDRPLLFADAAVVPEPDSDQLHSIAVASARSYRVLVGTEPRIACLSFSTHGSADHPSARRMADVARRLREEGGFAADGELQLDAALVPAVAASKAPGGTVGGQADLLLFPDLNAANIGYKMAQRLGGFSAVGPLLQGLARPVFDLSRGCDTLAVVDTVVMALLLGEEETP